MGKEQNRTGKGRENKGLEEKGREGKVGKRMRNGETN